MIVKPVKKYVTPKYPDKYELELDKTLMRYRPFRWLNNPVVNTALAALIVGNLTSCTPSGTEKMTDASIPLFDERQNMMLSMGDYIPRIADFMSEQEALNVIAAELEKTGFGYRQGGSPIPKGEVGSPHFDLQIFKNGYAMNLEFVSSADYLATDAAEKELSASGECYYSWYDIKSAAEELKEKQPDAVVFYDPTDDYNIREQNVESLKRQVADFIEWLNEKDMFQ